MKVVAVVPAFNEERTLASVLDRIRPLVDEMVVVDDGSADRTGAIAAAGGAVVVRHAVNGGLGAALATGLAAARDRGADVAVTLDADGQHDPREIVGLVEEIRAGADMVVGSRMLCPEGMPWRRFLANSVANLVTFALFGAACSDSQSGFRAFSAHALRTIRIRGERMEVSSFLVGEAHRRGLRRREVPVRAIYTEYSLSKGQSFTTGLRTLGRLLARRLTELW